MYFSRRRGDISKASSRKSRSSRRGDFKFAPRIEVLEPRCLLAADVILEWNDVMLTANAADHSRAAPEQGGPILTARAFAIVSAAMYDAFNSIERMGAPFVIRAKVPGAADRDAAVAQAAHDTLLALFPSQQARFESALHNTLSRVPDGPAEDQGRLVGAAVAQYVLDTRADDGVSELMRFHDEYQSQGLPGFHNVDPLNPQQGFYAPGAMHVAPFVVADLDQFAARRLDDGTPEGRLAFMASEEYRLAFEEVFALGGDGITSPTIRTEEQTHIGIYWGYDGRPGLGTPPRLYNQIAQTIAIQQNNSVADNARLFALLNISQADAGLTAWNNKYDDDFWRPVLGIRHSDADGNPATVGDPDWTPLGAPSSNPRPGEIDFTPPFPAYTSGHATFGASAFQTLARFYGRDDIPFSFVSDELNGMTLDADGSVRPLVARTFNSFSEAKFENGQSRIYLGIHWSFDRDDGIQTGNEVADYIFDSMMRPKSGIEEPLRHNAFDPHDVNDDGVCSPLDVLLVINVLNEHTHSNNYVDVNNDGLMSPIDALLVINRLNHPPEPAHHGEGEGLGGLTTFVSGAATREVVLIAHRSNERIETRRSDELIATRASNERFIEPRMASVRRSTVPPRQDSRPRYSVPVDLTTDPWSDWT